MSVPHSKLGRMVDDATIADWLVGLSDVQLRVADMVFAELAPEPTSARRGGPLSRLGAAVDG